MLVKASHSANIKERRDASCALFDPEGQLVMQAEHIPVHLGAMPAAVEAVAREDHEPGVSWVLNDPYSGGTHLPDITVITPAFAGDELIGFAANRAHHADVGGPTPGSMPADSTTLDDEGVVIEPQRLDEDAIERAGRADAPARAAPRRPPGPARRQPHRRIRLGELLRADAARGGDGGDDRLRRAPHPGGDRGARGRHARGGGRARGARGRPHAQTEGDRRGRRAPPRLHRHRRPARGQPQLPARGHRVGLLVRRARAHRPRHPAELGRHAAGHGHRARGLPAQREVARRGRGGQRRDRARASPTSC